MDIKIKYDSDSDDIVNDFYVPVLSNSSKYYRLSGFFSSSSLAVAARGMENFIKNNGEMKLICSAQLSESDYNKIKEANEDPINLIEESFIKDLNDVSDSFVKDSIAALGWMLAHDKLEIKIAIPKNDNGIFHAKVGILKDDEGSIISFSGSENETANGWLFNIEEFKVFTSWNLSQNEYIKYDLKYFNKYWNNSAKKTKIFSISQAIKNELINLAPKHIDDLVFNNKQIVKGEDKIIKPKITLFDYQIEARDKWFNKNKRGIFTMATGTGKTFTALGCLEKVLNNEKSLVTVISSPYKHLIQQWELSIKNFGLFNKLDKIIIIDGNQKGKKELKNAILDLYNGHINTILVLTSHDSLYRDNLIKLLIEDDPGCPYFLIADEMHGLGSVSRRTGLLKRYDYRLGLSATPSRYFDEIGTKFLYDYFEEPIDEKTVYEFSLDKAIANINPRTSETYLTPYCYYPHFLNLNEEELNKYHHLTKKLIFESNNKKPNQKKIERFLHDRSNIIKNASNKFYVLDNILKELGDDVNGLIIYCSHLQIDKVLKIVGHKYGLNARKFTNKESATPTKKYGGKSERDSILENFSKGSSAVLVAMHCLDEGVDVPSASKAILMCNTGNPREFIQRIGRVIRRYPSKSHAEIYDMVVKPSINSTKNRTSIESDIYEKELKRCRYIANLAINNVEANKKLGY